MTKGKDEKLRVAQARVNSTDEFTEWTPDDHLRHSKFVGLRGDKDAREVV
jgi:ATP-dependent DNA ligase